MKDKDLQINNMATFRIRVQGVLGEEWSARLRGLTILPEQTADDELPVSELTGQLRDQDELSEVLNTLYTQRLPLLSVEYLEDDENQSWYPLDGEDYLSDDS